MRARCMFDSIESAAQGLVIVLEDARRTKFEYSWAGISADQILKSGLILEGEISEVTEKLQDLDGSAIFVE